MLSLCIFYAYNIGNQFDILNNYQPLLKQFEKIELLIDEQPKEEFLDDKYDYYPAPDKAVIQLAGWRRDVRRSAKNCLPQNVRQCPQKCEQPIQVQPQQELLPKKQEEQPTVLTVKNEWTQFKPGENSYYKYVFPTNFVISTQQEETLAYKEGNYKVWILNDKAPLVDIVVSNGNKFVTYNYKDGVHISKCQVIKQKNNAVPNILDNESETAKIAKLPDEGVNVRQTGDLKSASGKKKPSDFPQ